MCAPTAVPCTMPVWKGLAYLLSSVPSGTHAALNEPPCSTLALHTSHAQAARLRPSRPISWHMQAALYEPLPWAALAHHWRSSSLGAAAAAAAKKGGASSSSPPSGEQAAAQQPSSCGATPPTSAPIGCCPLDAVLCVCGASDRSGPDHHGAATARAAHVLVTSLVLGERVARLAERLGGPVQVGDEQGRALVKDPDHISAHQNQRHMLRSLPPRSMAHPVRCRMQAGAAGRLSYLQR